jgi:hypothetical protein
MDCKCYVMLSENSIQHTMHVQIIHHETCKMRRSSAINTNMCRRISLSDIQHAVYSDEYAYMYPWWYLHVPDLQAAVTLPNADQHMHVL